MKIKNILLILIFLVVMFLGIKINAQETESVQKLRAGMFIKVLVTDELSTLTADVGDEVSFINIQDLYLYETNAVPKNTIIYGEVEDVLEPVQGRDGAVKILITKMITPDKKVYKFKGHIFTENDNYLGGNPTQSVYYRKVPHYTVGLRPHLQAAPLNVLEMGRHTIIKPGAELFVVLEEDVAIK